jgi:hypothetical protein
MIGTIARMYMYTKAPKATFGIMHPVRSARLVKTKWDLRHAYAPRIAAVGAAAVALPVGLLIGRMLGGHSHTEE